MQASVLRETHKKPTRNPQETHKKHPKIFEMCIRDSPYARITAYFPDGEVIYTNPFARYDASVAQTPYMAPAHTVNIPLTILFNFTLLVLCAGVTLIFYKTVIKW